MLSFDNVNRTIDAFFSDTRRPKAEAKEGTENPLDDVDQMVGPIEADA